MPIPYIILIVRINNSFQKCACKSSICFKTYPYIIEQVPYGANFWQGNIDEIDTFLLILKNFPSNYVAIHTYLMWHRPQFLPYFICQIFLNANSAIFFLDKNWCHMVTFKGFDEYHAHHLECVVYACGW